MSKNAIGVEVPAGSDAFDPQGDMVELGASLTATSMVRVADAAALAVAVAAVAPTALAPVWFYQVDIGAQLLHNGAKVVAAFDTKWQTYTPVWTSSGTAPSLGNGTLAGWYMRAGDALHFRVRLVIGSTTNGGTGVWTFSLPAGVTVAGDGTSEPPGVAKVYHRSNTGSTTNNYLGLVRSVGGTTTFQVWSPNAPADCTMGPVGNGSGGGTGRPVAPGDYSWGPSSNLNVDAFLPVVWA